MVADELIVCFIVELIVDLIICFIVETIVGLSVCFIIEIIVLTYFYCFQPSQEPSGLVGTKPYHDTIP